MAKFTTKCFALIFVFFVSQRASGLKLSKELRESGNDDYEPSLLPVGTVILFTSDSMPPAPWLLCDGSQVSRIVYQNLFRVIGTSYGEGDGVKTFNLPDLRGRVAIGADFMQTHIAGVQIVGKTGGSAKRTLTTAQLPAHKHAKGTYSVVSVGGHTHGVTDPGHNHGGYTGYSSRYGGGPWFYGSWPGGTGDDQRSHYHTIPMGSSNLKVEGGGSHTHEFQGESAEAGGNQAIDTLPPFQTVNYIILP